MTMITLAAIALLATAAGGQDPATCPMHLGHLAPGPYAGQQIRAIKALSEDQMNGYREGRGVGLAVAAELNHYPGPRHVLDLAGQLSLSPEQTARTQAIFAAMDGAARPLGRELVDAEAALDARFASADIDAAQLREATAVIGRLQSELRRVHLQAHIETRALLTPAQVARYDELRSYAPAASRPAKED